MAWRSVPQWHGSLIGASLIVGPSESFVDGKHSMTYKMHMHGFVPSSQCISA
ncbi:short chain dehydrogenase [Burkholderia humptydooensis MSMB43]|uniref:Short chain dehydrogenase n=1 Tax=Burkholderia humptydooensis MSMB43 TaxID=441157 RepID=A0ABN0GCH4_9BURK|nr:short chain dehydrogenase [Burkholderia humptydooensis MSMB43]